MADEKKPTETLSVGREKVREGDERETLVIVPLAPVPPPSAIASKEQADEVVRDVIARQDALRRVLENLFPELTSAVFVFTGNGGPLVYVSDMPRPIMADRVIAAVEDIVNMDAVYQSQKPPETLH